MGGALRAGGGALESFLSGLGPRLAGAFLGAGALALAGERVAYPADLLGAGRFGACAGRGSGMSYASPSAAQKRPVPKLRAGSRERRVRCSERSQRVREYAAWLCCESDG